VDEFNRQDSRQVRGIGPEAEKALTAMDGPATCASCANVIQRAVVLSGSGLIGLEHLPENVLHTAEATRAPAKGSVTPIREMERELILRALEDTNQDKRRRPPSSASASRRSTTSSRSTASRRSSQRASPDGAAAGDARRPGLPADLERLCTTCVAR